MAESRRFKLYSKLPVWLQNVSCSIAGLKMRRERFGPTFRKFLASLQESEWWSLAELKNYQDERLRFVIAYAYKNVPFYREVMDERKLIPADIRTAEDLPKLPILTKNILRDRAADLISRAIPPKKMTIGHTGGTTGKSLTLYYDKDSIPMFWAAGWRQRMRFGLALNDEYAGFAGRNVVPLNVMAPPFWRRNLPLHQTYISCHHMTQKNMPILARYLQKRKITYYVGYPSVIYLFSQYLIETGQQLPHPPKVIYNVAETLLPHQRRSMQEAFGPDCHITDQYGASEYVVNISACQMDRFHVDMEYGVSEFVPLVNMPSNVRRIVGTGLWNLAMPLIRYDIGDIATLPEDPSEECSCGRKLPMVDKIDGRIESYIITPDGRQAGRLDFLFKDSPGIEEAQLIQSELKSVTIKIVKNDKYHAKDEEKLLADLKTYLGPVIRFDLEYVDEIPRTANGKFRQIVSTLFKDQQALD
ncbi:hypothetical protein LCGC14_0181350 [marine sediment metagenome]|uniref:AMP-dependent synthetase/ligase domain-containing protein n=1 Tax=marine sediment metagenome TaxID=412755 RepID=A0A0F9V5U3_9ZZZZ|nr:phenylacetate--CoA ligase family protein [Phycisphaerae bacterium]HDZ44391.1 phenylacetate--CoA ligase family protein [Phycisphaerae bacterium]